MSTSLNLFAQNNVNLDFSLFGWHLFTWIPEQYQNLNSIWIVVLSPVLVFIYNSLGRVRQGSVDCGEVRLGFRGGRGRLFHLRCGRRMGGRRQGVLLDHGVGLRAVFARRAAGQRPGTGDDRPLRAGAHGRLHDGRLFRGVGPLAISRQRGREPRAHSRRASPIRSSRSTIYTSLFNKLGFAGVAVHGHRDRHAAADETAVGEPFGRRHQPRCRCPPCAARSSTWRLEVLRVTARSGLACAQVIRGAARLAAQRLLEHSKLLERAGACGLLEARGRGARRPARGYWRSIL